MYILKLMCPLFIVLVFQIYKTVEGAPILAVAKPRQFLPPIPGYIPVYIRTGDEPLEDINLDLAAAFKSYSEKHARFNSIRGRSQNVLTADEKRVPEDADKSKKKPDISFGLDDFSLDDDKMDNIKQQLDHAINKEKPDKKAQHIQKIPKTY